MLPIHRRPSQRSRRRGALAVEFALVMSTFLVGIFAVLELSLAVLHYNTLSEVARRIAREAIVHGSEAPPRRSAWGPAPMVGTGATNSEVREIVESILVLADPAELRVRIEWPEGSNAPGKSVRVTVEYDYLPAVPFLFDDDLALRAVSSMRVSH